MELLSLVTTAAPTVIHCCAARPPIEVFTKSGATGVAVDMSLLGTPAWDQIAIAAEAGTTLYAGVVPTTGAMPNPEQAAELLARRWRELGLDPELLKQVVITPACGLAPPRHRLDARARLKPPPRHRRRRRRSRRRLTVLAASTSSNADGVWA